jgi:hypothetical protein
MVLQGSNTKAGRWLVMVVVLVVVLVLVVMVEIPLKT